MRAFLAQCFQPDLFYNDWADERLDQAYSGIARMRRLDGNCHRESLFINFGTFKPFGHPYQLLKWAVKFQEFPIQLLRIG